MDRRWALKFNCCIKCGTSEIPHKAKGLCKKCYAHNEHVAKGKTQSFTCLQCGKVFSPKYRATEVRKFCSNACSSLYHTGKRRGRVKTREEVIEAMRCAIKKEQKYITKPKLMAAVGICDATFTRLDLTMVDIYDGLNILKKQSLEEQAYYVLKPFIPDLRFSKVFDDCFSPKGYKLRFDMYSHDLCLAIEMDGEHHRYSSVTQAMGFVQICDRIKDNYIRGKGGVMLRIPFKRKEYPTLETLIRYFPDDIKETIFILDNQQPRACSTCQGSTTMAKASRAKRLETRGPDNSGEDIV